MPNSWGPQWPRGRGPTSPCTRNPVNQFQKRLVTVPVVLLTVAFCFAVIDTSSELRSHRRGGGRGERAGWAGTQRREAWRGLPCKCREPGGADFEASAEVGAGASLQSLMRAWSFLALSEQVTGPSLLPFPSCFHAILGCSSFPGSGNAWGAESGGGGGGGGTAGSVNGRDRSLGVQAGVMLGALSQTGVPRETESLRSMYGCICVYLSVCLHTCVCICLSAALGGNRVEVAL